MGVSNLDISRRVVKYAMEMRLPKSSSKGKAKENEVFFLYTETW
jgi:hypothetical protein